MSKIRISDYPRQKKQEEIENPTYDETSPRPVFWDKKDSEDRPVGYHYDEGLQFVNGSNPCENEECDGGKCECEDGECSCSVTPPEPDLNPFENVPGYYPEGGKYHMDVPAAIAAKKEKEEREYPFALKDLVEEYKNVEKVPFQIQMGGKVLEIVVADDKDLYLIYELQQQVIYGVQGLKQEPLLSRILALLVELWPTSVFEVEDVQKLRSKVMKNFVDWYLEFGEVSTETEKAAEAFIKSLK